MLSITIDCLDADRYAMLCYAMLRERYASNL